MKRIYLSVAAVSALLLSACATPVKPSYVSPTQYQALNCQQLQSEYNRIQQYLDQGVTPATRTGVGLGVIGGGWGSRGGWGIGPSVSVNMGSPQIQSGLKPHVFWVNKKLLHKLPSLKTVRSGWLNVLPLKLKYLYNSTFEYGYWRKRL